MSWNRLGSWFQPGTADPASDARPMWTASWLGSLTGWSTRSVGPTPTPTENGDGAADGSDSDSPDELLLPDETVLISAGEPYFRSETTRYLARHGRAHALAWMRQHPTTSAQMAAGSALFAASTLRVMQPSQLLLHPALLWTPHWQVYRAGTNFLWLGGGVWDVGRRLGLMLLWNADMEVALNGGARRTAAGQKRTPEWSWRRLVAENRFLHFQLVSGGVLVALEIALYAAGLSSLSALGSEPLALGHAVQIGSRLAPPRRTIMTVSLLRDLEESVCWLWALMSPSRQVLFLNVVPVKPVFLPLSTLVLSGFGNWRSFLKGLAACVIACHVLDIRRRDGRNERVVHYCRRVLYRNYRLLRRLWLRWRSSRSAASQGPAAAPRPAAPQPAGWTLIGRRPNVGPL